MEGIVRDAVCLRNLLKDGDVGEGAAAWGNEAERLLDGEAGIVKEIWGLRGDPGGLKVGEGGIV